MADETRTADVGVLALSGVAPTIAINPLTGTATLALTATATTPQTHLHGLLPYISPDLRRAPHLTNEKLPQADIHSEWTKELASSRFGIRGYAMGQFKKPQVHEYTPPVPRVKPAAKPTSDLFSIFRMTPLPKMTELSVCPTCKTDVAKWLEKHPTQRLEDGTYPGDSNFSVAAWDGVCPTCRWKRTAVRIYKVGGIAIGTVFAALIALGAFSGGGGQRVMRGRASGSGHASGRWDVDRWSR